MTRHVSPNNAEQMSLCENVTFVASYHHSLSADVFFFIITFSEINDKSNFFVLEELSGPFDKVLKRQ